MARRGEGATYQFSDFAFNLSFAHCCHPLAACGASQKLGSLDATRGSIVRFARV